LTLEALFRLKYECAVFVTPTADSVYSSRGFLTLGIQLARFSHIRYTARAVFSHSVYSSRGFLTLGIQLARFSHTRYTARAVFSHTVYSSCGFLTLSIQLARLSHFYRSSLVDYVGLPSARRLSTSRQCVFLCSCHCAGSVYHSSSVYLFYQLLLLGISCIILSL
jgi:hypothetical protein